MKPRVYLETTIPSYLAARPSRDLVLAGQQQATRDWWETQRAGHRLYVSELVLKEVSRGDAEIAKARLALLESLPILDATVEALEVARRLIAAGVVPTVAEADAVHIANATVHGLDFLLTWNCKHINNAHIVRQIERLCCEMGYTCPVICTPEELREINL